MFAGPNVAVAEPESRRSRRSPSSTRPGSALSAVAGVVGELLVTAGVITLLYVVWQMWVGDVIIGAQLNSTAAERSQLWAEAAPHAPAEPGTSVPEPALVEPVIAAPPADGEVWGVMHMPRFGPDYAVEIAGGTSRSVTLDPIGIGHYNDTPMPGAVGNVALAAHRTTYGKPFGDIATLQVGDAVVIETPDGWYTYRFRTLEYVTPDAIEVIAPVPQQLGVEAGDRFLTLTSCSPKFSLAERIVAYNTFESFTPRDAGPPASLTTTAALGVS